MIKMEIPKELYSGCFTAPKQGYLICDQNGKIFNRAYIKGTTNELEYQGVVRAMELVEKGGTVYTDSKLVVKQVNSSKKVKSHNLKLWHQAARLLKRKKRVKIKRVSKEENKAGLIIKKEEEYYYLENKIESMTWEEFRKSNYWNNKKGVNNGTV